MTLERPDPPATKKEEREEEDRVVKEPSNAQGSVSLDSVVCRRGEPLSAELDGQIALFSIERGAYYALAGVGSEIWRRIGEPVEVASLCDQLCERFEVDRERCEREVIAFLEDLSKNGLISLVERAPA